MRHFGACLVAAGIALSAAPPPQAHAQRAHIGGHGGYHFDADRALIGAQIELPVTRSVELYPSFDYYFTNGGGTLLGFNGDLKFRAPGLALQLYFGGGLNVLRSSGAGASDTDTGFDVFGGLESRRGTMHPYIEMRGLFHSRTALQLTAGLNVTLY